MAEKKGRRNPRGEEVSAEQRALFRRQLGALGLNQKQLADLTDLSFTCIKKALSKEKGNVRLDADTIGKVVRALGLGSAPAVTNTFVELVSATTTADSELIPLVRDWDLPFEVVAQGYRKLAIMGLAERGFRLADLVKQFSDERFRNQLAATLPDPVMTIRIERDLASMLFVFGEKSVRLERPTLLWDCHCGTPGATAGTSECPIHSNLDGAELDSRFSVGHMMLQYDGIRTAYRQGPGFWPPSVDAFAMIENMREAGIYSGPHQTVLDLGSGSGILGIAVGKHSPRVQHLTFADWLMTPLIYSLGNWSLNAAGREYVQVDGQLGLFTTWLTGRTATFDLVVCNPPYLPLLKGHEALGIQASVAGTDLLVFAIQQVKHLCRLLCISFSDLAKPEADAAAKAAGVKLKEIGKPRRVPFRVRAAFTKSGYLDSLLRERKLEQVTGERHPYWHTIRTYLVRPEG